MSHRFCGRGLSSVSRVLPSLPLNPNVVTVYGVARQKTTVSLDSGDYRRLKAIARAQGRAPAELVREAVAEYTVRAEPRRRPRSIGAGRSRTGTVATRAEALLAAGFGRER